LTNRGRGGGAQVTFTRQETFNMDTEELRASLAILIAALRGSNEDCHRRAADSAAVSTMQAKALVQHESASAAKYREVCARMHACT